MENKKYSELGAWIATLAPGDYDVTIDCNGENDIILKADCMFKYTPLEGMEYITWPMAENYDLSSPFILKSISEFESILSQAADGVFFNITTTLPLAKDGNYSSIFAVEEGKQKANIKSLDITFQDAPNTPLDLSFLCFRQSALVSLKLHNADNVKSLDFALTKTALPSFDGCGLKDVLSAKGLFYSCAALKMVDTTVFEKTENIDGMFAMCQQIATTPDTTHFKAAKKIGNLFFVSNVYMNAELFNKIDWNFCRTAEDAEGFFMMATPEYISSIKDWTVFNNLKKANSMFVQVQGSYTADWSFVKNIKNADWMFSSDFGGNITTNRGMPFESLESAKGMFYFCTGLAEVDCTYFGKVKNADSMFRSCSSVTSIDFSAFKSAAIMDNMARDSGLTGTINYADFPLGVSIKNIASGTDIDTLDLSTIDPKTLDTIESLGSNCGKLTTVLVGENVFENVTDARYAFDQTTALKDISFLKAFPNIKNTYYMFRNSGIESYDFSLTPNIEDAKYMFTDCSALKSLKNMEFTASIKKAISMFENCKNLRSIDLRYFGVLQNLDQATNYLLRNGTAIENIDLGNNIKLANIIVLSNNRDENKQPILPQPWTVNITYRVPEMKDAILTNNIYFEGNIVWNYVPLPTSKSLYYFERII